MFSVCLTHTHKQGHSTLPSGNSIVEGLFTIILPTGALIWPIYVCQISLKVIHFYTYTPKNENAHDLTVLQ